jgi:hypothetical protein
LEHIVPSTNSCCSTKQAAIMERAAFCCFAEVFRWPANILNVDEATKQFINTEDAINVWAILNVALSCGIS